MDANVTRALSLARQGYGVFPCSINKAPTCRRAFHSATQDPSQVSDLWRIYPGCLIGVATGETSGFDVLDLDYRHGAAQREKRHTHLLPPTRTHITRSGGRHLLFRHAHGVRNSVSRIAAGADVRGEDGDVIFPPSSGYSVALDKAIVQWPDFLLAVALPLLRPRPAALLVMRPPVTQDRMNTIIAATLDRVRNAPEGGKHFSPRNAALFLDGIADRACIADATAPGRLLGALPSSVRDWRNAEATAVWGLENGRARPIQVAGERTPCAPNPRRREIARAAFRMLRLGVPSAEVVAKIHDQNCRRLVPLPSAVIDDTALWAVRLQREGARD